MTEINLIRNALGEGVEAKPEFAFAGKDATPADRAVVAAMHGKPRRWRFDWAFPAHRVAWEIEGGHWTGGRHNTGAGFIKDMEKYNTAALLGWKVIRSTTSKASKASALKFVKQAIISN